MLEDDWSSTRLGQLCSMRVERTLETVLIRLHGEFDLGCVERFREEFVGVVEPETKVLVMDLRGLEFIDSTGLQTLITLNTRTSKVGLDYKVLCGDGAVRRVLSETGLDGVLPVVGDFSAVPRSDSPI